MTWMIIAELVLMLNAALRLRQLATIIFRRPTLCLPTGPTPYLTIVPGLLPPPTPTVTVVEVVCLLVFVATTLIQTLCRVQPPLVGTPPLLVLPL